MARPIQRAWCEILATDYRRVSGLDAFVYLPPDLTPMGAAALEFAGDGRVIGLHQLVTP